MLVGLTHPADLRAWQRWQDSSHPARALLGRVRAHPATGVLALGGPHPDVLVTIDSGSPSNRAALLAPVAHLPQSRVAVLGPAGVVPTAPGWRSRPWTADHLDRSLDPVRVVVAAGHHLPLGGAGFGLARGRGLPYLVVQHGALTPHAPPLPAGSTLLAWSADDADFWRSGRDDVTAEVVGPQLLWRASTADRSAAAPRPQVPPTYLGQLHAAELPRVRLVAAAEEFCRATGATYRPHPSERDRRSRRQHERWQRAGLDVDAGDSPLANLATPVVSVFSTGVLEAAVRGLPAWVDYPDPPEWLTEFWSRYDMRPWGGEPTPAPRLGTDEPARRVAEIVERIGT